MQVTEKNCRVADKIMQIFADEECTVDEAKDIAYGVAKEVQRSSTVQIRESLFETYKDHFQ